MVPSYLIYTSGLPVPPISLEVRCWCLIQTHTSFNLVLAIVATDWPVSLLIALQIFATASLSSSDRFLVSLSICTSCSAVAALAVKPNYSLYHAMKFLWVSLSLAIGWVLVLAIKMRRYMAVVSIIKVDIKWSCHGRCSFAACCAESNGSDELRKLGSRPGG
jgi:hypothetical protein